MHGLAVARVISVASLILLAAVGAVLLDVAGDGTIRVYRLGDWPAPYGIVLVLDRLSALMVALTSFLGMAVVLCRPFRDRHARAVFSCVFAVPDDGAQWRVPDR